MTAANPTAASRQTILRVAAPLRVELMSQLRTAIARGEHEPGERLVERVICERYGVSRTVVREALRHLEAEGLVTILPNRGPVVTKLSDHDAVSLFEVRAVLEALAAELFAHHATDDERKALLRSCDTVASAFQSPDPQDWLAAKDAYYEVMLAGARNDVIRSTLVGLHARVQLLRGVSLSAPDRLPASLREIREIAKLAAAGKATEAFKAAKQHVASAAVAAGHHLAFDNE